MLGVQLDIVPADLNEAAIAVGLDPMGAVQHVARAKAQAVDGSGRPVLAADTGVILNGELLGKPRDRAHGAELLAAQSGQSVQVVSCVAVKDAAGEIDDRLAISTLSVETLNDSTIANYLATGEADDKAGRSPCRAQRRSSPAWSTDHGQTLWACRWQRPSSCWQTSALTPKRRRSRSQSSRAA